MIQNSYAVTVVEQLSLEVAANLTGLFYRVIFSTFPFLLISTNRNSFMPNEILKFSKQVIYYAINLIIQHIIDIKKLL